MSIDLSDIFMDVCKQYFSLGPSLGAWKVEFSEGKWPRLLGKFKPLEKKLVVSKSLSANLQHLRYVIFHLAVHAWLYERCLPYKHTYEFATKETEYEELGLLERKPLLKGLDRDYVSAR